MIPAGVVPALGWTLLHSLWQGALIAAALWIVLLILRQASPQARYLAGCAALALMALLPIATFGLLYQPAPAASATPMPSESEAVKVETAVRLEAGEAVALPREPTVSAPATSPAVNLPFELRAVLASAHPYVVGAWLAGVLLLALRLLIQSLYLQRLRSRAAPAPAFWQSRLDALAKRLSLSHSVVLLTSARFDTPAVIGFLKPAVLVPASALTGLSREQLEAIFAHELAHIRRYDALVNLVQTAVETLLFYHPAVWWVSAQIRAEREHCCDDVAVALCGNPLAYARALTALEGLRAAPKLALAMSEGELLKRVRRIVGLPPAGKHPTHWVAGMLLVGLFLASGMVLTLTQATAITEEPTSADVAMPPGRHTLWATVTAGVAFDGELRLLSKDAYVLIEERKGEEVRAVRVTRGDGPDDLVYEYTVSGNSQPFDHAAQAWFASVQGEVFGRFLSPEREDDPLAGGVRTGPPDTYTSFVRAEAAETFIRPLSTIVYQGPEGARLPLTASLVRAAHLRAHDLVGDEALYRFLLDAYRHFELEVSAWRELLFAAKELASDPLKAALLIEVAPGVPREAPAREAYRLAAASIGSPELRQRALDAVSEADFRDRPRYWFTLIGDVIFGPDFTTIVDVAEGSRAIVEERDGQSQRKLEVTRQDEGLRYTYTVDGQLQAFDEHAESWLTRLLAAPTVRDKLSERPTIEPSAKAAYARVQPDYVLSILQVGLHYEDEAQLRDAVERAVTYAHESGDDGMVLTRLVNLAPMAAHGIIASETYATLLNMALELREPSPQVLDELLYAVTELTLEPLRAELLLSLAPRLSDDAALRERYLASAATLRSAGLRRAVLEALEP